MAELNTSLVYLRKASIKVFEREGRDVHTDTFKTARDVGRVRLNYSRLNIFTYLAEGDKEDNFKFNVDSIGGLRLGVWRDSETRIQFFTEQGRLIADSSKENRIENEKYTRIIGGVKGGEPFEPGTYFIKASRLKAGDTTTERPFSLQIQMGQTVLKDFDTKEYDALELKPGEIQPFDLTKGALKTSAAIQGSMMLDVMSAGSQYLKDINNKVLNLISSTLRL